MRTDEKVQVTLDELLVEKRAKTGFASAAQGGLTVALNTEITPELAQEGLVREVIRAVQDTRKKLDLPIEARVHLVMDADEETVAAINRFRGLFEENVLLSGLAFGREEGMERVQAGEKTIGLAIRQNG